MTTKTKELHFVSSHCDLYIDTDGNVLNKNDLTDWLCDIKKVDIEELTRYSKACGVGEVSDGDTLDFGYWDNDGDYFPPSKSWREDVFHNVNETYSNRVDIINDSFKWISENR